jgi:hypothetical protein
LSIYEARPLNKSTDHTKRKEQKGKRQTNKKMDDVPGGNSQCSILMERKKQIKNTQKI